MNRAAIGTLGHIYIAAVQIPGYASHIADNSCFCTLRGIIAHQFSDKPSCIARPRCHDIAAVIQSRRNGIRPAA